LLDPGAQQEGKEKFVFLKQRATDITVQTEREEVVDVQYSLLDVVCLWKKKIICKYIYIEIYMYIEKQNTL
jgi:hypothetical protein